MLSRIKILLAFIFFSAPLIIDAADSTYFAKNGVINLSDYDFDKNGIVELRGKWKFYNNVLFSQKNDSISSFCYVDVPKNLKNQLCNDEKLTKEGFGTYFLQIIINEKYKDKIFLLNTRYIPNSSRIFVNGKEVGYGGVVGKDKENSTPSMKISLNEFILSSDTIDLVIQISNFDLDKRGIYYELNLGLSKDVYNTRNINTALVFFILGSIVLMILYYVILFILRKKDKQSIYFALLCLVVGIYTLCLNDLYYKIIPFSSFSFDYKIKHISIYLALSAMALYIYNMFRKEFSKKIFNIILLVCLVSFSTMIALNTNINAIIFSYFRYFGMLATLYVIYVIIRAKINKSEGAGVFIIGLIVIFIAVTNDTLHSMRIISTTDLLPLSMFIFLFLQTFLLSKRFTASFAKTEELTETLTYINKNLEKIVDERTHEISLQKKEIEDKNEELKQLIEEVTTQRDEIEAQRDLVTEQKEHIEEIHKEVSQSIDYATRIQTAILPDECILQNHISDFFVLFKPRDKVSGDFYWWANIENHTILTAADCTGHGVPGAFMSMLGVSFLREIVLKEYVTHPGVILRKLRKEIIRSLKQKGISGEQKDGMDMAMISINHETNIMQYAGANNPLYLIRDGELKEFKPDKMPIAIYERMDNYNVHEISLLKGDMIYLFSDGYPDQFGGARGKKFMHKQLKEKLIEFSVLSMKEQHSQLDKMISNWMFCSGIRYEQTDDITIVGIKI